MDRFLARIRSQSFSILGVSRQLSSYKPKPLDLKTRVVGRRTLRTLLDLVDQIDASNLNEKEFSSAPPLVVDTTYASLGDPSSLFPLPGRIGPDPKLRAQHRTESVQKLDPSQYGVDSKLLLNNLLTMNIPKEHQKNSIGQLMNTHMTLSSPKDKSEFLSKLVNNDNLEIRAYDCPAILRYELHRLFLNYNVLMEPLTAITIVYKTKLDMSAWSSEIEDERNLMMEKFIELAHEMCAYLSKKQFWADFIDPSSGRPYYGPHTTDTLFETDERFRYFGVNILDLGCCRVVEHFQHGKFLFSLEKFHVSDMILTMNF